MTPARVWAAVIFLMVVSIFNVVDRVLPAILVEPIKHDLALSDTTIGLINGFGFLIVYAVIGIPIARLSDRGRYGLVIGACLALWSLMTLLGSMAQTGLHLALTRMGVAVGEAGSSPAAQAFISSNFPPNRRSAPLAVLSLSVPLATLGANVGGGLIGQAFGWRMSFAAMGVFGLILAPLAIFLLKPSAGAIAVAQRPKAPPGAVLALLKKPSFLLILAATSCIGISGYSLTTFVYSYLMRVHGMTLGEVGLKYGLMVGALGIVSLTITAIAADRLSAKDARWTLWVVAMMIAAMVPFSFAAMLLTDRSVVMICLALANVVAMAYMAPVVSALHRLVPPELRATASAILLLCMALFGGLGPLITGLISDALHPTLGAISIARAMLVVPVGQAMSALLYVAATRTFRRDMVADDVM